MYSHARAALLFVGLNFATPAMAQDCSLKSLASLDMLPSRANRIVISANINGTKIPMLVDTGGGFSSVSDKTVKALGLTPQESRVKTLDLYGNASRQFARVDTIELGALKGKDVNLMIWPGRDVSFDGLIAGDMLERYDVELNFVTRKLNLFSHDHCEGKVVYWPATAGTVVPFFMSRPLRNTLGVEIGHDTHIRVPVTLDGKSLRAIIDTGAPVTAMTAGTAESAFHVTADSPGVVRLNADPGNPGFGYVFHSLALGGISVANPRVVVYPELIGKNDPDNSTVTGSLTMRSDDGMQDELIVGMDVLSHLHLYIAYGEQKLYITPPDQPAAAAGGR